jgi:hypothetical protein
MKLNTKINNIIRVFVWIQQLYTLQTIIPALVRNGRENYGKFTQENGMGEKITGKSRRRTEWARKLREVHAGEPGETAVG